jgi:hypothetical protein
MFIFDRILETDLTVTNSLFQNIHRIWIRQLLEIKIKRGIKDVANDYDKNKFLDC